MPYTKQQIQRIMRKPGQAFVPRERMPYAGRVAETLVRRKIFRLEDTAAKADYDILKRSFDDIRAYGQRLADTLKLDTLSMDANSITWRRMFLKYAEPKLGEAAQLMALSGYRFATTAYAGGYYGRLWLMDEVVRGRFAVNKPRLYARDVAIQLLQPGFSEAEEYRTKVYGTYWPIEGQPSPLTEAMLPDGMSYELAGQEWRDGYVSVATNAILRIRRGTLRFQVQKASIRETLDGIGSELGVIGDKPKGAYYQSQLITRAAIMRASNHGAVRAYQAQVKGGLHEATDGWILGAVFVTSHDERVCVTCASHDGELYALNDLFGIALLGLPPDNTHPGCRCSIIMILIPDLLSGNEPPQDTWDAWAYENGFDSDLEWFIDDNRLESTMV